MKGERESGRKENGREGKEGKRRERERKGGQISDSQNVSSNPS